MILRAHWINPTRPRDVRTCVEATIEHSLLDAFGGPEKAFRAREAFRKVRSPEMDWSRLFNQAIRNAGKNLTPSETDGMRVTVSFE